MDGKRFLKRIEKERSEIVGRILRYLRTREKLTQKEIAEKLGIVHQTYSGYETGNHEPSIEILLKLADFYNISMDFITGRYLLCWGEEVEEAVEEFIDIDRLLKITDEHYTAQSKADKTYMNMAIRDNKKDQPEQKK